MRTHRLAGWLWACVWVLSAVAVQAQEGYEEAPGAWGEPGVGYYDPGFGDAVGYSYPQGAPPEYTTAWPGVEPYMQGYEETYNRGGTWFSESAPLGRKYNYSLEFIAAKLRRPGTDTIGNPDAPPFDEDNGDFFRPYDAGVFGEDLQGYGIKGGFQVVNPDSSSWEGNAFWIGQTKDSWRPMGNGILGDDTTIRSRGGIPVLDELGGSTIPYDLRYELSYEAAANGAELEWYKTPFFRRDKFNLRTGFGLRYLNIREQFRFEGVDSGLTYVLLDDGTPDPTTITDIGIPPYESTLTSTTKSYLAGPQIALRAELGGDALKFKSHIKLAVTANHENVEVAGNNIADPFTNPFPTPTPDNLQPGAFRDSRTSTHVSPIFDYALSAEAPLFNHIPPFRTMRIFRDAKFRFGYNFVLAGETARPTKVINWVAYDPSVSLSHSRWTMSVLTFAVDFKY